MFKRQPNKTPLIPKKNKRNNGVIYRLAHPTPKITYIKYVKSCKMRVIASM